MIRSQQLHLLDGNLVEAAKAFRLGQGRPHAAHSTNLRCNSSLLGKYS